MTCRPLTKLEGRVIDRQGQAVAGALVRQPGGGPDAISDPAGRFVLERALCPLVLIARKPGFRFHGLAVSAGSPPVELVLAREDEPRMRKMATLPEPISLRRRGAGTADP